MECVGCAQAYPSISETALRFNLIACGAPAKKVLFVCIFIWRLVIILKGLIKF